MKGDRFAPPRNEPPFGERVRALRIRGWSDRSISRHLSVPIEMVRSMLGIVSYGPDGNQQTPIVIKESAS
ncbi:hypothetical protein DLM45_10820 [Hyphomicrobium methylovorum]|uniref:hypothetical protein n=1 Tax=Hyphomicrobium methylovorum TaxID=84 RepID=UPI0015E7B01A|nr:hypothetical protein [Hyphomicrobium methylovorum]MBA2126704.1 hypothetical protein [Hyphomicrobium methylovorum]